MNESMPNFNALRGEMRFFAKDGMIRDNISTSWYVYDHFQRRWYNVNYPRDNVDSEEAEDDLRDWVDRMGDHNTLNFNGQWSTCNDPDFCIRPVEYDDVTKLTRKVNFVRKNSLTITGALQPLVYVVGPWEMIFKEVIFSDDVRKIRREIECLTLLAGLPHVIPLSSVVLFDDDDRVAGFTTPFLHGGTLASRTVLKAKWFIQLMQTVDLLNKSYRIFHRDIAPRNILVDEIDNIRLIDFEGAVFEDSTFDVDSFSVVIAAYEAITKRDPYQDGEVDWAQTPERVRARASWVLNREWESKVEMDMNWNSLKQILGSWLEERDSEDYDWTSFAARACPGLIGDWNRPGIKMARA